MKNLHFIAMLYPRVKSGSTAYSRRAADLWKRDMPGDADRLMQQGMRDTPTGTTRSLHAAKFGDGAEGFVSPSYSQTKAGPMSIATKVFNPNSKIDRSPIPWRAAMMRSNSNIFPQIYGSGKQHIHMERLRPLTGMTDKQLGVWNQKVRPDTPHAFEPTLPHRWGRVQASPSVSGNAYATDFHLDTHRLRRDPNYQPHNVMARMSSGQPVISDPIFRHRTPQHDLGGPTYYDSPSPSFGSAPTRRVTPAIGAKAMQGLRTTRGVLGEVTGLTPLVNQVRNLQMGVPMYLQQGREALRASAPYLATGAAAAKAYAPIVTPYASAAAKGGLYGLTAAAGYGVGTAIDKGIGPYITPKGENLSDYWGRNIYQGYDHTRNLIRSWFN